LKGHAIDLPLMPEVFFSKPVSHLGIVLSVAGERAKDRPRIGVS
jgi:hypothetical protein